MFKKRLSRKQLLIDSCYDELEGLDPADPRYAAILDQLSKLETKPNKLRVSLDTLATLAAYVGVVLMVMVFEAFGHTITTKALQVTPFKPRL